MKALPRAAFEEWELALLRECRVARLGTISPGGRPRLLPVCYALVGEELAIAIDEKPKRPGPLARLTDIERDSRATLLLDRWDEDWSKLAWVRVEATATTLARGDLRPQALTALRARYAQYATMPLEELPLILLRPSRIVSWRASPPATA